MPTVREVLEGKPLRCPIHPALVHLPIALFPISLILDLAGWIWPDSEVQWVRGAYIALIGGVVTSLFAAIFGFIDYSSIRVDHRAKKTARLHMILNLIAVALFIASAALHHDQRDEVRTSLLPIAISLVG